MRSEEFWFRLREDALPLVLSYQLQEPQGTTFQGCSDAVLQAREQKRLGCLPAALVGSRERECDTPSGLLFKGISRGPKVLECLGYSVEASGLRCEVP